MAALVGLGRGSPEGFLNQHPLVYGAVSPIAKIHRSRNQGLEMEVGPLNITLVLPSKVVAVCP